MASRFPQVERRLRARAPQIGGSPRCAALGPCLHTYNHHRGHTALACHPTRQPRHQQYTQERDD